MPANQAIFHLSDSTTLCTPSKQDQMFVLLWLTGLLNLRSSQGTQSLQHVLEFPSLRPKNILLYVCTYFILLTIICLWHLDAFRLLAVVNDAMNMGVQIFAQDPDLNSFDDTHLLTLMEE